jgi:ABC-type xylose transport system permease subunit
MHDGPVVSEMTSAPTTDSPSRSRLSSLFQGSGRNIGLALALVLALLILAIFSPRYFSFANFVVVALQMSFIGILGLGTAVLIIGGNVDLSIGAMYGLTAVIAAMLAKVVPAPLALLVGILLAGALGWLNGAMVRRVKLSPQFGASPSRLRCLGKPGHSTFRCRSGCSLAWRSLFI